MKYTHTMAKVHVLQTGLPHWLLPKRMDPDLPLSDADLQYVFDEMVKGHTLSSILRDHPGLPDYPTLMRYIMSDPQLEARYYEQKRIQTEAYVDVMTEKSLGLEDEPEEIESKKLAINHLRWLVGVNNRKRYGDVKQLNINGQIDIQSAMARADQRVLSAPDVIEHED